MTYAAIPLLQDTAIIEFNYIHIAVLRGLTKRNPNLTLSAIIGIALEPFIYENLDAGNEKDIPLDLSARATTPV